MGLTCGGAAACEAISADMQQLTTNLAIASILFVVVFWIGFYFVTTNMRQRQS